MALVDIKKIYIDFCVKDLTVINCTQYDVDSRTFNVNILDNGKPYKIESDKSLSVKMTKKDGTMVLNPCVINDDGTATLLLTEQMCKFDGVYDIQFMYVNNATKEIIHTMPARINIAKSVADNVKIESKDEFKTLNDILLNLKDFEKEAKANEAIRQSNEAERENNEAERESTFQELETNVERITNSVDQALASVTKVIENSEVATNNANEATQQATMATTNANNAAEEANEATTEIRELINNSNLVYKTEKGSPNGVAELDNNGKVPVSQLPLASQDSAGIMLKEDKKYIKELKSSITPFYEEGDYGLGINTKNGTVDINSPDGVNITTNSFKYNGKEVVTVKETYVIAIGDSWGAGVGITDGKGGWCKRLQVYLGLDDNHYVYNPVGGSAFYSSVEGYSWSDQLDTAFLQINNPYSVTDILICGGINDHWSTTEVIANSIAEFVTKSNTLFPNAKITLIACSYVGGGDTTTQNTTYQDNYTQYIQNVIPAFQTIAKYPNCRYIDGLNFIYDSNGLLDDNYHPTSDECEKLSYKIANAFKEGIVSNASDKLSYTGQLISGLDGTITTDNCRVYVNNLERNAQLYFAIKFNTLITFNYAERNLMYYPKLLSGIHFTQTNAVIRDSGKFYTVPVILKIKPYLKGSLISMQCLAINDDGSTYKTFSSVAMIILHNTLISANGINE